MVFFNSPKPYDGQVFKDLKNQAKESGRLFEDPKFPATDSSLSKTPGMFGNVEWKRPGEIVADPHLFVEGTSTGDVSQGKLGNCWFVAATSCLAIHSQVWKMNIPNPQGQEWNKEKPEEYQGIFHFKFWRHGSWVDVVVDDRLPTANGKLIFVHSEERNEFWSALLEKAYAKIFGSYEALDGGGLEEALVDFTGGVAETINIEAENVRTEKERKDELWNDLETEMKRKSLMAAAIPAESAEEMEAKTDTGLVKGHAYGITMIKGIPLEGTGLFGMFNQKKIHMVRLRNPWGEHEWNGAFSDGSPEWDKIDKSAKKKIGLDFEDDGEFWMTFDDFVTHFHTVTICRVVNTALFTTDKTWEEGVMHGALMKPHLAGGCANNKDTYLKNPQFAFTVKKKSDKVLLSLQQKIMDRDRPKETIGFHILKVEENRVSRVHEKMEMVKSSAFRNSRSIFVKIVLSQGRYVVLPCTFEAGIELEFLLRVYTDVDNHAKILEADHPERKTFCGLCTSSYNFATRLRIVSAERLEKQDSVGGADPYVIATCEGKSVRIPTKYDTLDPEWNAAILFFRSSRSKPIEVEVYNENRIRDQFMGKVILTASNDVERQGKKYPLQDRKGEGTKPGHIVIETTTRSDLSSF